MWDSKIFKPDNSYYKSKFKDSLKVVKQNIKHIHVHQE